MGGKKDLWENCDCLKRIEEELARELAKKKNKA